MCQHLDGTVHRSKRLIEHTTMSHGQPSRLKGAQCACACQSRRLVPGGKGYKREERLERARDGDSTQRLEGVSSDEGTISGIEEGGMSRGVTRRGDDFK